ncbi:MAG: hypothetical protein A2600_06315 [Candidatus Lambdaproteobacteria bacterium RIFOXYD1_FULL_56_27]|uniref:Uncharacterized protein n=1 Tax=Candidatus Lambdaproteobacteria bacterium RIFOXYD2_FULL_56_26 TaxID=1817773 RepID=A0A1F6GLC0_9PROT|nr:MAG: hypothetical protein A2557_12885 [Candidatus Lambdaproteobacteria bacterium RIFOXYD2_FULL_56_26]OGH05500.1 MAG: hypothetical protein A2426_03885 [Candidatus Lambdaproteobacteria bacterium RIFOXYC1_FULL_56_13]OGH09791.1 MAG: hypothetical protein A2600_06315 [Candidatus Lambdaproteobacteria bacterium RIFOXYD1_FULL_56_27]
MSPAPSAKEKARHLYVTQALSLTQIAHELALVPSTILRYLREDQKTGLDWDLERARGWQDETFLTQEFRSCLGLLLGEAKKCLKELEKDPSLSSEGRAKLVMGLMGTIQKATLVAKNMDPKLKAEALIAGCLHVVGEVFIEKAPELSELFLAQTTEIERRILEAKERWQV